MDLRPDLVRDTGYSLDFLNFCSLRCPFPWDDMILVILLLRLGCSVNRLAAKVGKGARQCSVRLHHVAANIGDWDTFTPAFRRRWHFVDRSHPIFQRVTTLADSTHVPVKKPQDAFMKVWLWFNKPVFGGHALVFNANVNWASEIVGCTWWYSPKVSDEVLQNDLDSELPYVLAGARCEFRLADRAYLNCPNFIGRLAAGAAATPANIAYNEEISSARILVENVFANVKKHRFFHTTRTATHAWSYDFLSSMLFFAMHLHNIEQLWPRKCC